MSTAAESRSVQSSGWLGRVRAEISSSVVTNALLKSVAGPSPTLVRATGMVSAFAVDGIVCEQTLEYRLNGLAVYHRL